MVQKELVKHLLATPADEVLRYVTPGLIADLATDWLLLELRVLSLERELLDVST